MKTTAGKTRAHRPEGRLIYVYQNDNRERCHARSASSLKQALEEYYKQTLYPNGWRGKKIVGNVLSCSKGSTVHTFTALEIYQSR